MKRSIIILLAVLAICVGFSGCCKDSDNVNIAAMTRPVWEFTTRITSGSNLSVKLLITDTVSCLHDYSMSVDQARTAEAADLVILSGAGLEEAMVSLFHLKRTVDSSAGIPLLGCDSTHGQHEHNDEHHHDADPHIWLSPENAKLMATNIFRGLIQEYPQHHNLFQENLNGLIADLDALDRYGHQQLDGLSSGNMITFHDGFAYFADSFGCTIIKAIEEESGSEASAAVLKELVALVKQYDLPAVFTEENGSVSAARVIAAETGIAIYPLDMAMSDRTYFDAMYHNINTVKEALG